MTASPPTSRPRPKRNTSLPLDLTVNIEEKDGKRSISWEPSFRFIDTKTVTPDPETQKLVDDFKAKLDESLNVEIGTTVGPLDSRRNIVRSEESAIGNLIADAMRGANGADIAITNGGGIRADRQYDAGTVLTRRDILTELPFGNVTVVTAGDRPAGARRAGERLQPGRGRRRPVPAGLRLEGRRRSQEAGGKPRRLRDGRRQAARSRGDLRRWRPTTSC